MRSNAGKLGSLHAQACMRLSIGREPESPETEFTDKHGGACGREPERRGLHEKKN